MDIETLKAQIIKDTQKLGILEGKNGEKSEISYNDGGEVKYKTTTVDNSEEIIRLRSQIMQNEQLLEKMKANRTQLRESENDYLEGKKQNSAKAKETDEQMKKYYFKQIKQEYKKGSLFERIKTKKPSFKKISKLSDEELQFLIDLSGGKTVYQSKRNEEREKSYRDKGMSEADIMKKINKSNRSDFFSSLTDPEYLEKHMELEEGRHI